MLVRAGAQWLGVTCVNEGARARVALQAAGLAGQNVHILVMCGFLPEDVGALVQHSLTPVVWTEGQVAWLSGHPGIKVHVEVDTGMGRQGVRPGDELDELLDAIRRSGLTLDGIFTHFCSSEVAASELTRSQQRRFERAVAQVRARGLTPAWLHAGNSSFLDNLPPDDTAHGSPWLAELAKGLGARPMARSGLALYGYCLPIEGGDSPTSILRPALRPAMTWKTRVLALHQLAAGDTVGYGASFVAPAAMRVALLPVGYADGLRRELSASNAQPGGWVMLRGHRARIVGRISMNLTVVDVTEIEGVATGEEAVLLGDGITAEDHASLAATIPYEILCGVRER
jgi:alanine racemase